MTEFLSSFYFRAGIPTMSSGAVSGPEEGEGGSEEFVSDPGERGVLSFSHGGNDVSDQVAVFANSMLSELQRIADLYCVDPGDMSHLARLMTSSLEELDMMISEHSNACQEQGKLKGEVEQLLRKLTSEQEAKQASDKVGNFECLSAW